MSNDLLVKALKMSDTVTEFEFLTIKFTKYLLTDLR